MWRRWPQATNFMGYQPFRGPGNRLFKIMRNTKKGKFTQNYDEYMEKRPFNIMRKKDIFLLIITRNILQYIFQFHLQFPIAEFVVPSGCVVKANIAQRH